MLKILHNLPQYIGGLFMPGNLAVTYPFDVSGALASNLITNESQILTPANGIDFHILVPELGPYFSQSLVLTIKLPSGVVKTLVEGIDYQCVYWFISASRACALPIYGGISFLDLTLSGIVTLQYQTLGGNWVLDTPTITAMLADVMYNPRITALEEVTNYPIAFPPTPHQWNLVDMVGMSNVVAAIEDVNASILAQIAATAAAVALKVDTYPPATIDSKIAAEATRAEGVEASLLASINAASTSAALTTEITRAEAAEGVLTTNLANEVTRATAAELAAIATAKAYTDSLNTTLSATIAAEVAARLADDTTINAAIANEVAIRTAAIAADIANANTGIAVVQAALTTEVTNRTSAITTVTAAVTTETTRATTAEATLTTNLTAEIARAEAAEAALAVLVANIVPNNEDESYWLAQAN